MANQLLKQPWFRLGATILIVSGVGIGVYSAVVSSNANHPVIAESLSPEALQVTAFRSPTCGCCGAWIEHMQAQGFQVKDNLVEDMEAVKREHNVPGNLAACHTAVVNGYVVEGHIPAADVNRLLTEKPEVLGIAVPGMPIGSPGMESETVKEPYTVFTFDQRGQTTTFQDHTS